MLSYTHRLHTLTHSHIHAAVHQVQPRWDDQPPSLTYGVLAQPSQAAASSGHRTLQRKVRVHVCVSEYSLQAQFAAFSGHRTLQRKVRVHVCVCVCVSTGFRHSLLPSLATARYNARCMWVCVSVCVRVCVCVWRQASGTVCYLVSLASAHHTVRAACVCVCVCAIMC